MSKKPSTVRLVLPILILLFVMPLTPSIVAHASDDSNNGKLTLSNNNTNGHGTGDNSTVTGPDTTSSQTIQALTKVSQGINSTQYQNLVQELKNEISKGDTQAANNTINQLQNLVNQDNQQVQISPTAKSLVESLRVKDNGLTVDPASLRQFIGPADNTGVPIGLNGMDPTRAAQDLTSLASLLQGIDPSTADSFTQDATNIQDSILRGLLPPPNQSVSIPPVNLGNGPSFNPSVPSITPFNVNVNGSPMNVSPVVAIILMTIIVGGILAYALSRKHVIKMPKQVSDLARRIRPLNNNSDQPEKYGLHTARDLIIYYFRKTTRIMSLRGVPKQYYETHREFSTKCVSRREAQPVDHVSSLYEKAMFSGREVNNDDVNDARNNVNMIESLSLDNIDPVVESKK